MKIYVGNLSYSTTEADLRGLFEKNGAVSAVNLITDKSTGQSKGFAFVEMDNQAEGDKAISDLNDTDFQGRNIRVSVARPPEKREFSSSRQRNSKRY
jgi:cold-inducible RNA-binding protein